MTIFSSELPSSMLPYNVKSLNVANFGMPQIKQMSKAIALDSIVPVIEALSEVVDMDGSLLTDGDFSFLIMHQRINVYATSKLVIPWTCENVLMREQTGLRRRFDRQQIIDLVQTYNAASEVERVNIQNPEKLLVVSEICNTENSEVLSMDDLVIHKLTTEPLDPRLDYPRLATYAEGLLRKRDPKLRNLVDAARWVKEGDTLSEKFEVLESQETLELLQLAMKAKITHEHGVSKYVPKKCSSCGLEHVGEVEAGADLFFRV